MSEESGKVCCNCRHCVRIKDVGSGYVWYRCSTKDLFLSSAQVIEGWCGYWATNKQYSSGIEDMLDLFYANKHLYEKIKSAE